MIEHLSMLLPVSFASTFDRAELNNAWSAIQNRVIKFSHLNDNWDGEGAVAPDNGVIYMLNMFISEMKQNNVTPPSRVIVGHGGEIIIEWQFRNSTLEIETDSPGIYEFMLTPDEGEPSFYHFNQNYYLIQQSGFFPQVSYSQAEDESYLYTNSSTSPYLEVGSYSMVVTPTKDSNTIYLANSDENIDYRSSDFFNQVAA